MNMAKWLDERMDIDKLEDDAQELQICPNCEKKGLLIMTDEDEYGEYFREYRCLSCGFRRLVDLDDEEMD
jgi:DNA-directed RNA polymerase subunit RPC12/RpoP